jgi:hypothetical protein
VRKKKFNELPEVISVLGNDFKLTVTHESQILELEQIFGRIRNVNCKNVAYFVKYDLQNWVDRLEKLKLLGNAITRDRYILMMGEEAGKEYWTEISNRKKYSQTANNYIDKFGEIEGKRIWDEIKRKRSISTFNVSYWIGLGYSEKEAKVKVSEIAKKGADSTNIKQAKQREIEYENWAKKMPNTKFYWVNQGYSEEDALKKVTERQTTFSKEKCIAKYGEIDGLKRWEERQERWQFNLHAFNESKKKEKYSTIGKASKESILCFQPILDYLKSCDIDYYFGEDENTEFRIFVDNRWWLFDLTIPELNLCFEYNGEVFHPNPKWLENDLEKWINWQQPYNLKTAEEVREYDLTKHRLLKESNNFDVFEIWSSVPLEKNRDFILKIINDRLNWLNC